MASVFSMVLTTDVDVVVVSIDGSVGVDACDNCVEVKFVVEIVVAAAPGGDPHITLKFPFDPPEIQVTRIIKF